LGEKFMFVQQGVSVEKHDVSVFAVKVGVLRRNTDINKSKNT
jgi:hypothetical protein